MRSPVGRPSIARTAGLAYPGHLGKLAMIGGAYGYADDYLDYTDAHLWSAGGDSYFLNTTWAWGGDALEEP